MRTPRKRMPKNDSFVQTPDGPGNVSDVNLLKETVKVRLDERAGGPRCYHNCEVCVLRNGKGSRDGIEIPDRAARALRGTGEGGRYAPHQLHQRLHAHPRAATARTAAVRSTAAAAAADAARRKSEGAAAPEKRGREAGARPDKPAKAERPAKPDKPEKADRPAAGDKQSSRQGGSRRRGRRGGSGGTAQARNTSR